MNLPPLHSQSYRYDNYAVELGQLDARFFPNRENTLDSIRSQQGGKGVSLELSQAIAKLSPRFVVPQYYSISADSTPAERYEKVVEIVEANPSVHKWVLRSSNFDEDWLDARCGLQQSMSFSDYDRFRAERRMLEMFESGECHVLQEHVRGIGHVIDLAYSPLFARPILHIASGHFYHLTGQFSSATNDLEAAHALFDLKTGEQLYPNPHHMFGSVSQFITDIAQVFCSIAPELPDFGHQFEVIAGHKVEPNFKINMVQVRPSPLCVRTADTLSIPEATPLLHLAPAAWSGSVTGRCEIVSGKTDDYLSATSPFAESCKRQYDMSIFEPNRELEQPLAGKILVWKNLTYHIGERLMVLVGAALQGATAQIVEGACFTNSNHDGFQPLHGYDRSSYDQVVQRCMFLGVQSEGFRGFERTVDMTKEITLVCDGFSTGLFQDAR